MQLKVSNKYKRTGTRTDFSTKTGDIIQITEVTEHIIRYFSLSHHNRKLSLDHELFKQEYKPLKKPISFKGIHYE